jgi:hypothetical protein
MTTSDQKVQQQQGTTFHQFAAAAANDTGGGRFAAIGKPTITGTTPIPQYPQAGPPFQVDPVGDEPPLSAHENPALDETSTAPCVEATDDPADAPLSGMVQQPPSGGSASEPAGSSPFSQQDQDR